MSRSYNTMPARLAYAYTNLGWVDRPIKGQINQIPMEEVDARKPTKAELRVIKRDSYRRRHPRMMRRAVKMYHWADDGFTNEQFNARAVEKRKWRKEVNTWA